MTESKQSPFVAPEKLAEAAEQIAAVGIASQTPLVIVGGYAMQLYGSPRLTSDLDFIAPSALPIDTKDYLTFGGQRFRAPNGVPVDVIVRSDDYKGLYDVALETAQPIADIPVPVVRPELLAVLKMAADRPRDLLDLDWLIAHAIDVVETRRWVVALLGVYAGKEFSQTVSLVRWRLSEGEEI